MKTPMVFRFAERARSFRHAFNGIAVVIRTQPNALIHLTATVVVVALGWYVDLGAVEWCVIVLAIGLVWVAEALNTAIEYLGDEISSEKRTGIGFAKDVGAGAVLLAAICAVVVGLIVFVPHFLK